MASGDSSAWAALPEPAVRPAREAGGQVAFEIEFLERLLASSPNHLDALRRLAELLARHGRVEEALALDRRLVALRPEDCVARYNLACTLARGQHPHEALAELEQAILAGYDDLAFLEGDRDLECLRDEPAYHSLLRELRRQVSTRDSRN
jgi:tetratricopeptide (TPR) repeat protein